MFDRVCSVDGCEARHKARGWCDTHYRRWYREGDPEALTTRSQPGATNPMWRGDSVGYAGAHIRVQVARGSASECSFDETHAGPYHWAFDHVNATSVRVDARRGFELTYSTDPDEYIPLCVSCHRTFDRQPANA